jgi:hypothetical protein
MTKEELLDRFNKYVADNYGTYTAYAKAIGKTRASVSAFVCGKLGPSTRVLKDLGLRKVVTNRYVTLDGDTDLLTEEEVLSKLSQLIKQYGSYSAYAAAIGRHYNTVTSVARGAEPLTKVFLTSLGLKKVKTVTYEPIELMQPGE